MWYCVKLDRHQIHIPISLSTSCLKWKFFFLISNELVSLTCFLWLCLLHLLRSCYEDTGSLINYNQEQTSEIFAKGIILGERHFEVCLTSWLAEAKLSFIGDWTSMLKFKLTANDPKYTADIQKKIRSIFKNVNCLTKYNFYQRQNCLLSTQDGSG